MQALSDAIAASRDLSLRAPEGVDTALEAHRAIAAALHARDPAAARKAMERHLDLVAQSIRTVLTEASPERVGERRP